MVDNGYCDVLAITNILTYTLMFVKALFFIYYCCYQCFIQDFFVRAGRLRHVRDFGGISHINHAFRDYSVRADKIQLSKCNARIHTGFCVGGCEGDMCGRW